jgi:type III secretory pathway component EscU
MSAIHNQQIRKQVFSNTSLIESITHSSLRVSLGRGHGRCLMITNVFVLFLGSNFPTHQMITQIKLLHVKQVNKIFFQNILQDCTGFYIVMKNAFYLCDIALN